MLRFLKQKPFLRPAVPRISISRCNSIRLFGSNTLNINPKQPLKINIPLTPRFVQLNPFKFNKRFFSSNTDDGLPSTEVPLPEDNEVVVATAIKSKGTKKTATSEQPGEEGVILSSESVSEPKKPRRSRKKIPTDETQTTPVEEKTETEVKVAEGEEKPATTEKMIERPKRRRRKSLTEETKTETTESTEKSAETQPKPAGDGDMPWQQSSEPLDPVIEQIFKQKMEQAKLRKEQREKEKAEKAKAVPDDLKLAKSQRRKKKDELLDIKTILSAPNDTRPHTVLIDAYQLFFKQHFAHKHLVRGAVFGFCKVLLRMIEELKPYDFVALCSDSPGRKSKRDEIYYGHKMSRPRLPNEFVPQFCDLPIVAKATNLALVRVLGYEGDDILASTAKKAEAAGHRVTIITLEKELPWMISPNISVFDYSSRKLTKYEDIKLRYGGMEPNMIAQVQAICGDNGTRVNGIGGIGEKVAVDLIQKFGSLENVLNAEDDGSIPKLSVVKQSAEAIRKNYEVLQTNSDLEVAELESIKWKPVVEEELLRYLTNYSFNSLVTQWQRDHPKPPPLRDEAEIQRQLKEHQEAVAEEALPEVEDKPKIVLPPTNATPGTYKLSHADFLRYRPEGVTLVRDKATAKKVVEKLRTLTDCFHAIDTEAVEVDMNRCSYGQGKIICFSIYCGPDVDFGTGPKLWIDNLDQCEGLITAFKEYFEDEKIKKVWHNYGFDRHVIENYGVDMKGFGGDTMQMARLWDSSRTGMGGYSLHGLTSDLNLKIDVKRSIKDRFGSYKTRKDGTPGKQVVFPKLDDLQRSIENIHDWIDYSTFDAECTWEVRKKLEELLKSMKWVDNLTMWDFYEREWAPFGHLLTEIEKNGIRVDTEYLKTVEVAAQKDYESNRDFFLNWAAKHCPDGRYMNIESDPQKQQLLFAPYLNRKTGRRLDKSRIFVSDNDIVTTDSDGTVLSKRRTFTLDGLGIPPLEITESGWPAVTGRVIEHLAGPDPENNQYGTAYSFFKGGDEGREACLAFEKLLDAGSIQTLLSTFIQPLQTMVDSVGRIHTSLNVNTETGRLSSRRPNLQNQPALEKDKYKVRSAFTAEEGKALVVADYGQLELRLLAHMTKCKSMIDAFQKGGDFHSRTAMGMYPEIAQAVERGEVLLEWDKESQGPPPVPLLKDKFANERRKAKVLNFSIAYGKTAVGLSKDWGVSLKEAEDTLERWYNDRPEVREWQQRTIEYARETGYTRTLLGRYRKLPDINSIQRPLRTHAERAAINTPLQGGAADVVIRAMILLESNERLKELGWKQVLQIHDEIILEGPQETVQEAVSIVRKSMSNPLDTPLLIDLDVEVKSAKNWYLAK